MIYRITGPYIIEEFCQADRLDQAIKLAYDYALSWAHKRPVFMKVHTEEEPIEYSFGFYMEGPMECPACAGIISGSHKWHEVCRILPSF